MAKFLAGDDNRLEFFQRCPSPGWLLPSSSISITAERDQCFLFLYIFVVVVVVIAFCCYYSLALEIYNTCATPRSYWFTCSNSGRVPFQSETSYSSTHDQLHWLAATTILFPNSIEKIRHSFRRCADLRPTELDCLTFHQFISMYLNFDLIPLISSS